MSIHDKTSVPLITGVYIKKTKLRILEILCLDHGLNDPLYLTETVRY